MTSELSADLIITSARLWDRRPLREEAIAVGEGRILATGSVRQVLELASPTTSVVDAADRRLIPGLIDSHIHLVRAGLSWQREVRWDGLDSLEEGLTRLSQRANESAPGTWIAVVGGWHPHQFVERRGPTRSHLDSVAPDQPVFVQRNYVESLVNKEGLRAMGWLKSNPQGLITNPGQMAALRAMLSAESVETAVTGTTELMRDLNRLGLTGAIDAAGFGMTRRSYEAVQEAFLRGEKGFRIRLLLGAATPGEELGELRRWVESTTPGGGDEYVSYLGAGEILDYGAHDMEGLNPKETSSRVGHLAEIGQMMVDNRWPAHVHAILDSTISSVLDGWERVRPRSDLAALRFAICHADQISDENVRRVRDLGIGVTVQAGMSFRTEDSRRTWEAHRLASSPPLRTLLEAGIPLGAGSDGTVAAAYNPWPVIAWMTTGRSVDGAPARARDQRLTRDEALRLYTSGSAWFSFEEETRGNLAPGSDADFAVLSADPLQISEDRLSEIESVLTVVGGRVVHDAGVCAAQKPR